MLDTRGPRANATTSAKPTPPQTRLMTVTDQVRFDSRGQFCSEIWARFLAQNCGANLAPTSKERTVRSLEVGATSCPTIWAQLWFSAFGHPSTAHRPKVDPSAWHADTTSHAVGDGGVGEDGCATKAKAAHTRKHNMKLCEGTTLTPLRSTEKPSHIDAQLMMVIMLMMMMMAEVVLASEHNTYYVHTHVCDCECQTQATPMPL